jgi:hypothetical protein
MNGLYIEYNIRGEDGKIYPNVIMTSKDFGQEVFDDLTQGEKAGTVSIDNNLEGIQSEFDVPVKYDRAFVILP